MLRCLGWELAFWVLVCFSNLFMNNLRWMNIQHVVCYWIWMGIYINTRTSFEGQIICLILLIPLKKYTQCSYIWFQFHTRLYKSLRIFNELFQKSPPLSIEDSEFWILKIPGSRWKKSRKTPGGSESFDGIPGKGGGYSFWKWISSIRLFRHGIFLKKPNVRSWKHAK